MILPVKIETLMWLLPIVFMFHDFEEIIMVKPWINANRTSLARLFPRWSPRALALLDNMSPSAFALAVAEEFIILSALTLMAVELELYSFWAGLTLSFFIHLLVHLGQYIIHRKYIPVILTSLPSGLYCLIALHDLNIRHPLEWQFVALWTCALLVIIGANLTLTLRLAGKFEIFLESHFGKTE